MRIQCDFIESVDTSASGSFMINELAHEDVVVTLDREIQGTDNSRLVTSLDALAALKLAVGINPNGMDDNGSEQIGVSAYQFIAADVNKSGKVTSADALEILRMAVRVPNSTEKEWLFIDESEDFWDESANNGQGALEIDRTSVSWDSDGIEMTISQAEEKNFVGVMLGDVYSSWQPPENADSLSEEHFINLEDSGVAPMYQWGMSPQDFSIKSDVVANSIEESSGQGQVVYTIKSNDPLAAYSIGQAADSADFNVDPISGEVTLAVDPDFNVKPIYSFEVIATNSGGVSLSQIVSLEITERDPSLPIFESGDVALAIDENTGENQLVYTAIATNTDPDQAAGPITFSLS